MTSETKDKGSRTKSSNFRLPETLLADLQVLSLILDRSQTDIVKESIETQIEAHRAAIDEYNNSLQAIQAKLK
jgi:predicted DNA-binding protein